MKLNVNAEEISECEADRKLPSTLFVFNPLDSV